MTQRWWVAAVVGVALLGALSVLAAGASDVGEVKVSRGAAYLERDGARLPAVVGTGVRQGDLAVTGTDGALGITFGDNTLLSIGPNSRLAVERFDFNPTTHRGTFETALRQGTLAGVSGKIAKQSPDAMKVRTPVAVLGVRGTEFLVRTGPAGPGSAPSP